MKKSLRNQAGFTLVELMIVIVIVGILAAVAVPIYQSNINKAKMSECDAALGTIRTSLRVYYAQYGNYPTNPADTKVVDAVGIDVGTIDLTGRYFVPDDYTIVSSPTDTSYIITCTKPTLFDSVRTLDQGGYFLGGPQ